MLVLFEFSLYFKRTGLFFFNHHFKKVLNFIKRLFSKENSVFPKQKIDFCTLIAVQISCKLIKKFHFHNCLLKIAIFFFNFFVGRTFNINITVFFIEIMVFDPNRETLLFNTNCVKNTWLWVKYDNYLNIAFKETRNFSGSNLLFFPRWV